MKKVKVHNCHNNGSIFNTGQWVKHEDYLKLQAELEEVRKEYNEIIMEVKNKHPHMSRHRLAVEIIKAHENQDNPPCQA